MDVTAVHAGSDHSSIQLESMLSFRRGVTWQDAERGLTAAKKNPGAVFPNAFTQRYGSVISLFSPDLQPDEGKDTETAEQLSPTGFWIFLAFLFVALPLFACCWYKPWEQAERGSEGVGFLDASAPRSSNFDPPRSPGGEDDNGSRSGLFSKMGSSGGRSDAGTFGRVKGLIGSRVGALQQKALLLMRSGFSPLNSSNYSEPRPMGLEMAAGRDGSNSRTSPRFSNPFEVVGPPVHGPHRQQYSDSSYYASTESGSPMAGSQQPSPAAEAAPAGRDPSRPQNYKANGSNRELPYLHRGDSF